jgi:hypothetical protein
MRLGPEWRVAAEGASIKHALMAERENGSIRDGAAAYCLALSKFLVL